jgi:hypothetical protein
MLQKPFYLGNNCKLLPVSFEEEGANVARGASDRSASLYKGRSVAPAAQGS